MTHFEQTMSTNKVRMVVLYRCHDGKDQFQWGLVGDIPILTLVGAITRVQSDVVNQLVEAVNECPEQALVIAFQAPNGGEMEWFLHRDIPIDPLIGMLETIKTALIGSAQAQYMASNRVQILGPDGNPMKRRMT